MILLVDADSLIFASCYRTRHNGEELEDKYYRDIKDAANKFDEQFMKIINDIDEVYDVKNVITFNGSKGNFRKKITPKYKANRKKQELPPLLHQMHEYVKKNYNSVYGYGLETDDLVAKHWREINDNAGKQIRKNFNINYRDNFVWSKVRDRHLQADVNALKEKMIS